MKHKNKPDCCATGKIIIQRIFGHFQYKIKYQNIEILCYLDLLLS